jgi:hypothetical protein
MGSARFAVDTDGLDTLSGHLTELASTMAGIATTVSHYDPLDLGPGVATAAENFSEAVAANLSQVEANVTGLRDRLTAASGAYCDTELRIATAATPPAAG